MCTVQTQCFQKHLVHGVFSFWKGDFHNYFHIQKLCFILRRNWENKKIGIKIWEINQLTIKRHKKIRKFKQNITEKVYTNVGPIVYM